MRYRHKKRGGVYEIASRSAKLQCSTYPEFEQYFKDAAFTIYVGEDGEVYVRPTAEFFDGRFEELG